MGWVVNATLRPLYPREGQPVPLVQVAEWAGLDGCGKSRPVLAGFYPQTVQLATSCYSDCGKYGRIFTLEQIYRNVSWHNDGALAA
jgi:hypothetical protein